MRTLVLIAQLLVGTSLVMPAAAETYKMTTPIAPGIATPDEGETSIGTLKLHDGVPSDETTKAIYDNLDRSRALQAYLLGIPIVNQVAMRNALREYGPVNTTDVIWENLVDSKTVELTANDNTVYSFIWLDTSKGPLVVEIPPKVLGLIDDMWYRWVADVGITGADHGKGGKYLILPPGYKGEVPDGYFVVRPSTYGNWMPFRSFLVDGSPKPGVDLVKKTLKIYPLGDEAHPQPIKYVNLSGVPSTFVAPADYSFWELLNEAIQEEPPEGSDPTTLGLFASIGIEKGKPFAPDERMKKILADAANIGAVTARTIGYKMRDKNGFIYPDSYWRKPFFGGYKFEVSPGGQQSRRRDLLLLLRHRRHTGDGRKDGGRRFAVPMDGARRRRKPLRRVKNLQATFAAAHPGQGFLVGHRLRHPDPLHAADRPAIPERVQPGQGREGQCRRVCRRLVRPKGVGGHGAQLGADHSRQRLVHDPAALWPARTLVQPDLAPRKHRTARQLRRL